MRYIIVLTVILSVVSCMKVPSETNWDKAFSEYNDRNQDKDAAAADSDFITPDIEDSDIAVEETPDNNEGIELQDDAGVADEDAVDEDLLDEKIIDEDIIDQSVDTDIAVDAQPDVDTAAEADTVDAADNDTELTPDADTNTCSGIFPNQHGGLCWTDKYPNTKTWADADTYCGLIGGRLPTISELRTLIQNCPSAETGGACGVTDSCLNRSSCYSSNCAGCTPESDGRYSVFGDTERFWSSSPNESDTTLAWGVHFGYGYVNDILKTDNNDSLRCVHDVAVSFPVSWWKLDDDGIDSIGPYDTFTGAGLTYSSTVRGGTGKSAHGEATYDIDFDQISLLNSGLAVSLWVLCLNQEAYKNGFFTWNGGSRETNAISMDFEGGSRVWLSGSKILDYPSVCSSSWLNLVYVYDNGNIKIYSDGQLKDEKTADFSGKNLTEFVLGVAYGTPDHSSESVLIDDVMLFDKALSASEVTALYNDGLNGY